MPASLSARLALRYAAAILVLLSAFAVFCYAGYQATSRRSFDRHLLHELGAVAPFVQAPGGFRGASTLDETDAVATRKRGTGGTFVRLLSPDGAVLYRSPNFEGYPPLPVSLPAGHPGAGRAPAWRSAEWESTEWRATERGAYTLGRSWGGAPARTLLSPIVASGQEPPGGGAKEGWIEVTGFVWGGARELRDLAWTLAGGVLAGVLFALVAGWWLARRALRPVAVLTGAARTLAAPGAPWGGRLPATFGPRDELTRLAETFNGLLERLEEAAARERRFTSNAAHELLTPLSTLRSEAEVTLRRERTPEAYREALGHVVADAAHLAATVRALLELARAERLRRTDEARLDLGRLVRSRVERFRPDAEEAGLALAARTEDDVRVAAEAAPLTEVVDNLIQNAVKYTPPGGRVTVTLSHGGVDAPVGTARSGSAPCVGPVPCSGTARLLVSDTGAGFDQEECERLFDRFYRSDQPAVQAERGSGLGLSIVKAITEAYGGSAGCASDGPGRGARFWVELPCLGPHGDR